MKKTFMLKYIRGYQHPRKFIYKKIYLVNIFIHTQFIMAVFKIRSKFVKCCFRADKQVSRVMNIRKIYTVEFGSIAP